MFYMIIKHSNWKLIIKEIIEEKTLGMNDIKHLTYKTGIFRTVKLI